MSIPGIQKLRQENARRLRWTAPRVIATVLLGLFLLYLGVGFLLVPWVAPGQIEKRLTAQLGRNVTVQRVHFNPLTLAATIEGFSVAEADGSPFAGWRRLFVNFESSSFPAHEWRFKEVALEGLNARFVVRPDGKLNLDDLIQRLSASGADSDAKTKSKAWPLAVAQLHLTSDPIIYEDYSRPEPFKTSISPADFTLHRFHTTADRLADGVFTAQSDDGETFSWKGTVSLAPLQSSGDIELKGLPLAKYAPFYDKSLNVTVATGTAAITSHYDIAVEEGKVVVKISDGNATLNQLEMRDAGGKPVLKLDTITATGVQGSTAGNAFTVKALQVGPGKVTLTRNRDGLSASQWVKSTGGTAPASSPKSADQFSVTLTEGKLDGLSIDFTDTTGPRPAPLLVSDLSVAFRDLSTTDLAHDVPLTVAAKVQGEGSVRVDGKASFSPVVFDGNLVVEQLPLAAFSPWIEASLPYRVQEGRLSVNAQTRLGLSDTAAPAISANASASVDGLKVVDVAAGQPLLSFTRLGLDGVELTGLTAMRLGIGQVTLDAPKVEAVLRKDGTWNLLAAKPAEEKGASAGPVPATPSAATEPAPFVSVNRIQVDGGILNFTDRTIEPEVHASMRDFGGTIEGLSSEEIARAKVDLSGKVEGASLVSVAGQINPLSEKTFTDLTVKMQGMDLSPLAPYVGKFAGRELTRGSANLDVNLHVSSEVLDSANVLVLDQFTLGNATNSKDATNLPVGLALALLRDRQGKIRVDLPVQGRLDDPEFRVGRVIKQVVVNLLTKVATSPFSLIGAVFGGGSGQSGDDLAVQEFPLGSSTLDEDDVKELRVVAKALVERPGLSLDISGSYDTVQDSAAMKANILRQRLQELLVAEMKESAPPGAELPSQPPSLTPEGEQRLLQKLYLSGTVEFEDAPKSAAAPARGSSAPQSKDGEPTRAPVSESWIQRVLAFFSGRNRTDSPRASGPPTHQSDSAAAAVAAAAPPPDQIREKLLNSITIDEAALKDLAARRATEVRAFLVNEGKAPADHVLIAPPVAEGAKVRLNLK